MVIDGFQKHGVRANPPGAVAVELPVDDKFFLRFGMAGDGEDLVFPAFVVLVNARPRFDGRS